jgi:crossover junction endodeoxyribonuclease RusA
MEFSARIFGRPAAQGSKRHVGNGRFIEASRFLPEWRQTVSSGATEVARLCEWVTLDGPVEAHLVFYIGRPASVKAEERPYPIKPPDLDKLSRAVCDSLTDAGIWEDDGQVVKLVCEKVYVDPADSGVSIIVRKLDANYS